MLIIGYVCSLGQVLVNDLKGSPGARVMIALIAVK